MPESDNNSQARGPDYLAEIIKAIGGAPPPHDTTSGAGSDEKSEAPSGGDILSSLLSNPELMTKLPTIIAAVKPFMEMMSAQGSVKTDATPSSAPVSAPIKLPSPQRGEGDSRTALLCAMKPYLSAERSRAIDYIVKLGRLGDILKTL